MTELLPHRPTGESYPAATIRQMALVPNDRGQRDRMVAELPHMLDSVLAMDEAIPAHAQTVHAKRPWWAFWMTMPMVERHLRQQMETKTRYCDDGEGTVTMRLKVQDETFFDHTYRAVPEPMLTLYYVQLEGTAEGEEGDLFWSGAFQSEADPAAILVEAAELEALESGSFHSGRVMRCYGPFVAMQPVASMEAH